MGRPAPKLKVPAGRRIGGPGVAGWPGATGRGDPIVGNGWKKKLLAGLVGGLAGVVGGRALVIGDAGNVGVGRRKGVVGELGAGVEGDGDAGRGAATVEGSGKLKGWNAIGPAVGAGTGLRVVEANAGRAGVVGRGVGEKAATVD